MTRFARRYSAHPWASPLRGQRRRCSKTLPAFLSGQPAYCVRGLSNWRCQLSNPGRGFSSPGGCHMRKKPVLAYELFLKYGGEGGLTRFARPCGAARSQARDLSNWRCQLSNPGRGFSSPRWVPHAKKKPVLAYELFLKYGGEGGLTRFARPCGAARLLRARSVQLAAPVVEPRSGVLIPRRVPHAKKSPYLRTSSS